MNSTPSVPREGDEQVAALHATRVAVPRARRVDKRGAHPERAEQRNEVVCGRLSDV